MRETYETKDNMYIIMEQVSGGELFDHIKTYELEEREVGELWNSSLCCS